MRYISQPDMIAKKAKKIVEQLNLGRVAINQKSIVHAMVQATADPSIAEQIRISPQVTPHLYKNIVNAKILCDVEMVKAGINQESYTGKILCFIEDSKIRSLAAQKNQTRSMLAVDLWQPHIENAVILIGNAPTALFRFIELMQQFHLKPKLIIGTPVGFVGAAQAKRLLWQICIDENLPCITLLGPRGGSALAVSALHAIAQMVHTHASSMA